MTEAFNLTEEMAQKGGTCPSCGKMFRPNGVGPEDVEVLRSMLDNLPSSHLLRYGANYHDWYYHLGPKYATREHADLLMWSINKWYIEEKASWWNAWYYRIMNKRNYLFVREFGGMFYNDEGCENQGEQQASA